jgi:hypothetical protein
MRTIGGKVLEVGESLGYIEDWVMVCGDFRKMVSEEDSVEDGKINEQDEE